MFYKFQGMVIRMNLVFTRMAFSGEMDHLPILKPDRKPQFNQPVELSCPLPPTGHGQQRFFRIKTPFCLRSFRIAVKDVASNHRSNHLPLLNPTKSIQGRVEVKCSSITAGFHQSVRQTGPDIHLQDQMGNSENHRRPGQRNTGKTAGTDDDLRAKLEKIINSVKKSR